MCSAVNTVRLLIKLKITLIFSIFNSGIVLFICGLFIFNIASFGFVSLTTVADVVVDVETVVCCVGTGLDESTTDFGVVIAFDCLILEE